MNRKFVWLAALALLAALTITGTAFAEGELPPESPEIPAVTDEVSPPEEPAVVVEEPVDIAENPPDEVPLTDGEQPTVQPEEVTPVEVLLVEEMGTTAPPEPQAEITEPMLVDAEGEPLVMATEETAEALAVADPYFVSGGTTYSFYQAAGACAGAPNCWDGLANPIQYAIDYIEVNATAPDDGRIYIEKATYAGNVTIDGTLSNLNTLTGLVGLPTGGLFPTLTGTLTIGNHDGGFELIGLNVTGGILIHDSSGQYYVDTVSGNLTFDDTNSDGFTGHGIHIKNHKGNIVLNNAIARNNTGRGVFIETQLSGNVTIFNSAYYENNGSHGLKIQAKGIVSLDGVHANGNDIGIVVDTCTSLTIKNSEANNNHTAGIWVEATGKPVTLENVTANNNGDVSGMYGIHLLAVGAVNGKNIQTNSNYNTGLRIVSIGPITLTSISAIDNTGEGINVDSAVAASTINGAVANDNDSHGIHIETKGVILKNAVTINNESNGVYAELSGGTGVLENIQANENGNWGIYLSSNGLVNMTTKSLTAFRNEGGVSILTQGAVTMVATSTGSSTNYEGIYIATKGAVKLTDIWAGNNALSGLKVEGIYTYSGSDPVSMVSPASILINIPANTNFFNGFNNNGQLDDSTLGNHGIHLISEKAVTINNFYTGDNFGDGIHITGPDLYDSTLGYYVLRRSGPVSIVTTIPDLRSNADRNDIGIEVYSAGTVTLGGIDTNENRYHGMDINTLGGIVGRDLRDSRNNESNSLAFYNDEAVGFMPVSLTNIEVYETQADWGGALLVHSKGAITINGLNLYNNNSMGAALANAMAGKGNITVSNANIGNSYNGDGLQAFSNSSIILNNVWVHNSGNGFGAYLTNSGAPILAPISLTNCGFDWNSNGGLYAKSRGLITLKQVNANGNNNFGIALYNDVIGSAASVSLTEVSADNNNGRGLDVFTNGSVTMTNIYTHDNAKTNGSINPGETVQDFFNSSHGPDRWWFNAEYDQTYSFTLTADTLDALNRTSFDPWIELYDPDDESNPIAVSITCTTDDYCQFSFKPQDFGYTDFADFYVLVGSQSNDGFYHLSMDDPDPSDSTQMFWITGTGVFADGSINVNGIESHYNSLVGLGIESYGSAPITLTNIHISDNGSEGVYITASTGSTTIQGESFSHWNGWDGVIIYTNGAITVKKLDVQGNGQATSSPGFSTREDAMPKAISLANMNVNDNGSGLWAHSTLAITLNKVFAYNNFNEAGISLNNCLNDGSGNCAGNGNVTLTSVYSSDNQGVGIQIRSKGVINLNTVEANNNWQSGIVLDNKYNGTTAGVTLAKVRAENNGDTGIRVFSHGSLVMGNIKANNNALTWGGMDSGQTMQDFYNMNKGPDHWWFYAEEGTPYTISLVADGYGATGLLNRFDFDPYLELYDSEFNEITGFSVTHVDNDYYKIDWTPGSGESGWVSVEASSTNNSGFYRLSFNDSDPGDSTTTFWVDGLAYEVDGNVILTGVNSFNDNEQAGLIGWNSGAVALANVGAWGNGAEGVYVDNTGSSGNLTLSGYNVIGGNGWEGLRAATNGAVNISNLYAGDNGQDGILLAANGVGKAVTLLNITTLNNQVTGLTLVSHGLTTITNLRSWFNIEDGANINTNGFNLKVSLSSFMCNGNYGLAYMGYIPPFTFTEISNIYLANGNDDLKELH